MNYQELYDAYKKNEFYGDVYGNPTTEDFLFIDDETEPQGYVFLRPSFCISDNRNYYYYEELTPDEFLHYCIVHDCYYRLTSEYLPIDFIEY